MTLLAVDGVIDLVIFPYLDGKLRQRDIACIAGARFFMIASFPVVADYLLI
jgi:hypothetical protein